MTNKTNFKKVGKQTGQLIIETYPMEGNQHFENIGINMRVKGNMEHVAAAILQAFKKFPDLGKYFIDMQKTTIIAADAVKDLVKAGEEIKQAQEQLVEAAQKSMEVVQKSMEVDAKNKGTKGTKETGGRKSKGLKVVKGEKVVEGEK